MRRGRGDTPWDEGMEEYWRWRNNIPQLYTATADMPYWTSMAFEYLVNKYGKDSLAPLGTSGHMELLQKVMERVYTPPGYLT